jgi:hypothetical protein
LGADIVTSSRVSPSVRCAYAIVFHTKSWCMCTTHLGLPVEPLELSQVEKSSR